MGKTSRPSLQPSIFHAFMTQCDHDDGIGDNDKLSCAVAAGGRHGECIASSGTSIGVTGNS